MVWPAAVGLLAAYAQTAAAETCLDQVRALAGRYGISTDPPTAAPGGKAEVTPQDLARSGGVITPPPMSDRSVITPAPDKHDPMPTVPDVDTKKQSDRTQADRSRLQAALVAARAQAERGDEKGCEEALGRARTLADQTR